MTPAVNCLKRAKIDHQLLFYDHDPDSRAYGEEAAKKLNLSVHQIFKTLVVAADDTALFTALVPVSGQLDLKAFARVIKAKKAGMADKGLVERSTGYLLGGVSPLGQKKRLKTIIDTSALNFDTIYVSGGRRGLQVRLSPRDLEKLTRARYEPISTV
jgi:Cys-tRNA(Pro)/Cys-tRNA(Cys) deacylase